MMKKLILAGAAAFALTAAPAISQDNMDGEMYEMSTQQTTMYEGWPAERRTAYDAWPMGVQEYYWTLTPAQTSGWWALNDEQRVRVYEMTPQQRATAWTQISSQLNGATPTPANTNANASAMARNSTNIRFVRNERVQATPGDSGPPTGDLPICTPNQQDNCINSWEARGTGTKPLDYWPGRPASEM